MSLTEEQIAILKKVETVFRQRLQDQSFRQMYRLVDCVLWENPTYLERIAVNEYFKSVGIRSRVYFESERVERWCVNLYFED